jgi:CheY-like chemotaxis protein
MTSTTSRDRVLIVEDDPTTRLGLTELVGAWGFVTEAAADGEEALKRITAFRPPALAICARRRPPMLRPSQACAKCSPAPRVTSRP